MVLARKINKKSPLLAYCKHDEVKKMIDLSQAKIEKLFYDRIRRKTMQSMENTFDFQFSDAWH